MFEKGLSLIIPDVLSVNRNVPKEYFRNQSFVIDEFLLRKLTVNRGFSLTIRMINTDSDPCARSVGDSRIVKRDT